jgi:hypothetical protein
MAASITVAASGGSQGKQTKIEGEGFLAGEIVQLYMGGHWAGSMPADGGGRLNRYMTIPQDIPNGTYYISARGANSDLAAESAGFVVA